MGVPFLGKYLSRFEPETAVALEAVGSWYWIVVEIDAALHESHDSSEAVKLLSSIPGVSFILSVVILSEIGDIARFATAAPAHQARHLALPADPPAKGLLSRHRGAGPGCSWTSR